MDENQSISKETIKSHLKVLLLHLAAKSEQPSIELHAIVGEVIEELHLEVKHALSKKPALRLVSTSE